MNTFTNKVVVTGGNSGMGLAAVGLQPAGARVVISGEWEPSPLPQITRFLAVGISFQCLPSIWSSGPKINAVQKSVLPSRSTTPTTRWMA